MSRDFYDGLLFAADEYKKEGQYWLDKLSGDLIKSYFPYDNKIAVDNKNCLSKIKYDINAEVSERLQRLSNNSEIRLHMILTTTIIALLHKYTQNKDIVVGMPIYKQDTDREFINTILTLRNQIDNNITFKELLLKVKNDIVDSNSNQNYPIEVLLYQLGMNQTDDSLPLFDVIVLLEGIHDINYIKNINTNIIFSFKCLDNCISGNLYYNEHLYNKESVEKIVSHYLHLLDEFTSNINAQVSDIEMLLENEKYKILYDFNNTKIEYPKNKAMHELFEEQAKRTPNNIALVYEEEQITYYDLNQKANKLAMLLREKGLKPGDIVGVAIERSVEMIESILAILKLGCAYLPIDIEYPIERISYMLKDSNVKVLLTKTELNSDIKFNGKIINISKEVSCCNEIEEISCKNNIDNLAYIIYTSGTTNKPKGVAIQHKAIVNTLLWRREYYRFNENDVTLQIPSFSFDSSVEDIFTTLISGGKLVMIRQQSRLDLRYLKRAITSNKVTHFLVVPNFYQMILDEIGTELKTMKKVTIAGDSFSDMLVKKHFKILPNVQLYNEYGPTENSVCSTVHKFEKDKTKIVIGKPINNVKCYIVDENNYIMPIGIVGELCVSGEGLAKEYINNSEYTNEKFIEIPWNPGHKMYKTGDYARWNCNGELEFLGRKDNQIKIRGFRIELGEIETQLLRCEEINEAAVVIKEDEMGNKEIWAYIVGEKQFKISEIRKHLITKVPEYMIPAHFVQLEQLPLTYNGKVDRKKLKESNNLVSIKEEYMAPRNDIEKRMVEIWKDILSIKDEIGINDNFFEIGGHSLNATTLSSRIHQEFDVLVPLLQFFKTPTIKELSQYIVSVPKNIYSSIGVANKRGYYPASAEQERIFILNQLDKDSISYNLPTIVKMEGRICKKKLEDTFKKLIDRHESLRSNFVTLNEQLVQKVNDKVDFNIEYFTLSEEELEGKVKKFIRPFDLSKDSLIRVAVMSIDNNRSVLVIDIHHIISDGVSTSILIKEFGKIYNDEKLDELKMQYKDYSVWQKEVLDKKQLEKQEEYWLNKYNDELPILNLQTDFARPIVQSFEGDIVKFSINKDLKDKLQLISKKNKATLYMVLFSAYNALLYKYTNQEDIIIGSPIAGRSHADLENIVGMFVNTLAIRTKVCGSSTMKKLLNHVRETCLGDYENQNYQFESLIDKLNLERDISRNPLFDVMFSMSNMDIQAIQIKDITLTPMEFDFKISKFDLSLNSVETSDGIEFGFEYCTKLFKRDTIERMSGHYLQILNQMVNNINIVLDDMKILSEVEERQLLVDFNNTSIANKKDRVIQEVFEEQVRKTPDNVAVIFNDTSLTYGELNEKSDKLAKILREKGVTKDQIVGLMVEPSLEMIIGLFGILKSGGAYMPISIEFPKERIQYMLDDSRSNILVVSNNLMNNFNCDYVNINDIDLIKEESLSVEVVNEPSDLAYVIYTSGSTGKPKGVMVEHKNVSAYINAFKEEFKIDFTDTVLQQATYCFDGFVEEVYPILTVGGKIVIMKKHEVLDGNKLKEEVCKNNITLITGSPLLLNEINKIGKLDNVKIFISGGDVLKKEYIDNLLKYSKVYNTYGPTETTVCATYFKCEGTNLNHIPIGKPISNYKTYVLDKNNKLLPIGVAGELCISGKGVARGYLNNEEMTSEKFVKNPFITDELMYKTGDLVKWMPDGNIQFIERVDKQVKIRGFRIELSEIESVMTKNENVKQAVVMARSHSNGEKYLSAYIITNKNVDEVNLREFLSNKLPEYMIPTYIIEIDSIPFTANGKINEDLLPKPKIVNKQLELEDRPADLTEKLLQDIWKELLNVEGEIGVNDNFFHIGGHSLKAVSLVNKIEKQFNVQIPLIQVFKTSTIREIARYINQQSNIGKKVEIEKNDIREHYPLSSAQKRMFISNLGEENNIKYNLPTVVRINGVVDKEKLQNVFKQLIDRHEILRTGFEILDLELVQKIYDDVDFKIEFFKSSECDVDSIIKDFIRSFDLKNPPLIRVGLCQIDKEKYILMMDTHHIVSDGVSTAILINDFVKIWNGSELEELKIQYKDYAIWQENMKQLGDYKKQEEYWLERFKDKVPKLNIKSDYPRPKVKSFKGDQLIINIDKELTKELVELSNKTNTTLYMLLISAYNVLLYKYSDQNDEDIIIGSPIAGRTVSELENVMGMFVNMIAIMSYPRYDKPFNEFLSEVKTSVLEAYQNQDYQFDDLVDKLNLEKDTSRNPLFDACFAFQNIEFENQCANNLEFSDYQFEYKISRFDLLFVASELEGEINLNIQFSTDLFKKGTIEKMAKHYIEILDQISKDDKKTFGDIVLSHDLVNAKCEILTDDETIFQF